MRNRSEAFGEFADQRVGFNPDEKRYYIRNQFGAEITIEADQMDALIEKSMHLRNRTRRLRRKP